MWTHLMFKSIKKNVNYPLNKNCLGTWVLPALAAVEGKLGALVTIS